jgi:hypothetical protein
VGLQRDGSERQKTAGSTGRSKGGSGFLCGQAAPLRRWAVWLRLTSEQYVKLKKPVHR